MILCLGAGAPADLKAAGIESPRPLATISEAVTICRSLFAGEMADFHGKVFDVAGRRPRERAVCRADRDRGGRGPTCCSSPAAETDGVLISAATSPPFVKACLDQADAGKPIRKAGIVYTRVGPIDSIRRPIGFVLRGAHHAENVRRGRRHARPGRSGRGLCVGETGSRSTGW